MNQSRQPCWLPTLVSSIVSWWDISIHSTDYHCWSEVHIYATEDQDANYPAKYN